MENPHGDHAPVTPAASAAAARTQVSMTSAPRPGRRPPRSARHLRLEVHDAEHPPPLVAVARQRGVPVDAPARVRAAVDELADVAAATAIPGAVDLGAEAV